MSEVTDANRVVDELDYYRPEDVPDDLTPIEKGLIAVRNIKAWTLWFESTATKALLDRKRADRRRRADGGESRMIRSRFVPTAAPEDWCGERAVMMTTWNWVTRLFRRLPPLEPLELPPPESPPQPSSIEEDLSITIDQMKARRERLESLLRRRIVLDDVMIPHRRRPRSQGGHS